LNGCGNNENSPQPDNYFFNFYSKNLYINFGKRILKVF